MKWIKLLMTVFIIINFSCTEKLTGPAPMHTSLQESLKELINIRLEDYDSLMVENSPDATIKEMLIDSIQIGRKITGSFVPDNSQAPVYVKSGNEYSIHFSFPVNVYENFVRVYHFTTRWWLRDTTFIDIDTLVSMYKFPYADTEIFARLYDITGQDIYNFVVLDSAVYFTSSAGGISVFNPKSCDLLILPGSIGGRYLAGNKDYLFTGGWPGSVRRYNFSVDSSDAEWSLFDPDKNFFSGMACDSIYVFVSYYSNEDGNQHLLILDFNGETIQNISFSYGNGPYNYFDFFCNALYYHNYRIFKKLDLSSLTESDGKPVPSLTVSQIRFHSNKLYFLDPERQFIGVLPVEEIL